MHFASDNAGPAHPAVIDALVRANEAYAMGYGNDDLTRAVQDRIRELFEAPRAAVHLVATGTAANSLILATLARPWETIFCTAVAHIAEDECNAPEFFTGGAKLTHVPHRDGLMSADALADVVAAHGHGVHMAQRGPVSITQVTERGTLYPVDEIAAIAEVAHAYGLPLHLDGARFANALVALGCTPAEMTWKAGVDAVSFGGTKNGLMGVEACVIFDPESSWELELRRKRAGHLFSKHRYLAAQMEAYLAGDLWRAMARDANAAGQRLAAGLRAAGLGPSLVAEPQANMLFVRWPRALHRALFAAGAVYYVDGDLEDGDPDAPLGARLVCDWSMGEAPIDTFLGHLARARPAKA